MEGKIYEVQFVGKIIRNKESDTYCVIIGLLKTRCRRAHDEALL